MVQYEHVISLGWFCSVAEELERLGLRKSSYPFDWVLSDLETVYDLVEGEGRDFLEIDRLRQDGKIKNIYYHKDRKCLTFVHDINPYLNFEQEIEKTKKKYTRRLERLWRDIQQPSIFLRYIMDQEEYDSILQNRDEIEAWVKKYHPDNQIIFIADEEFGKADGIWSVKRDSGDIVAREFMIQLPELKQWLLAQNFRFSREENLKKYRKRNRKKKLLKYPQKLQNKCRQFYWVLKRQK